MKNKTTAEVSTSIFSIRAIAPHLLLMATFSFFINILYLSSPLYLIQIYNRVLVSGSESTLILLSAILLLAIIVMFVLDFVRAKMLIRCSVAIDRKLSGRVFTSIVERAWNKGTSLGTPALRDFDECRKFITGPGAYSAFDAPWAPLYLVVLYIIDPVLAYIGIFGVVILTLLALLNERITREPLNGIQSEAKRSFIFAENAVRNADVVRAMGMLTSVENHWQESRAKMLFNQALASERNAVMTAGIRYSRLMLQSAMLGVGAWLAIEQVIMPATIFACSIIMGRALAPVEQAVASWRQARTSYASYNRIKTLLTPSSIGASTKSGVSAINTLEVKNVSFVPAGKSQPIFEKISFKLAKGEVLGIAGASGTGKSTLVKLIIGALQPSSGSVHLGELATRDWDIAELGRLTGYLSQQGGLFSGTIRENIARFSDTPMEEVVKATEIAGIHKAILELPDQYETVIGLGGARLSGGQMQQLGLARALLCKPQLIVLDEPSSNLDETGRLFLRDALMKMKQNGAIIVLVTQMVELIEFSDKIITLNADKATPHHQLKPIESPPEKRIRVLQ